MAGQLNGQLWFVIQGTDDDDIDGHVNANASNITTVFDNIPAVPGAGFQQGGSDLSIGLDLPDGLYFVVNSDGLSISVHSITTGTLIDTLQIGDFNGSTANQDIVNSLVVDPNNHVVYVGRWGETRAESGIVAVSYTTAGDLDNNQAYNVAQTRLVDGNDPGVITDVRYMDLSNNGQFLYYTDNDNNYQNNANATFPSTNAIFRIDLTNPAAGATKLSDQAQFPVNLSNGLIGTVTADEEDGIIYFTTHQFNAGGGSPGQDALWWMPIAGGTATKITLPANALHYAGEWGGLSYDRQTGQLYISDVDDPGVADPLDRHIVQLQMSADGKSVTSVVNTFTTDQLVGHATGVDDPNSYPQGTMFDLLPIITVTGTTTHAAEQVATPIDLTTVATSVTDADNNFLASATVQITGGTFVSNETSANDDHLSVNDGGVFKITGTFTGTSITISYDSATEKLTLTGVDTLAHYQTVLNAVSYNTTGDNPTNYGNNASRTVTWTLSDGAPNVPDGGQNQTTTTLNIDAKNDAPVNHLPATPSVNEDVLTTISGISITDVDADPANQDITVTFSVVHGTLTFNTAVAGGITGADITGGANGSNTVTLTATQNQINATLSSGTGFRYQSDLNFNSGFGTETLHIVTSDNGHTDSAAFPGAQGDTDDLIITVNAVNDNPNLQPDTTTPVSYTENAVPTALFAGENVDTPLGDVDQSANYSGGSIDLNITAGLVTGDRIDLTGSRFVIVAGNIQDTANGNAVVGTIGATNATSHVTVLALTSAATPSVVDALIQAFGFDSTSDNPGSGDRTVTLTFNDGGNTGSGGALTDAVTQTVHVIAVNDAPVSTITPTTYSATEQVNLSLKNNGLSVSDVDGNAGNETITISVTEGTLTVTVGDSGVTVNSGNGTSSVVVSGTLTQLNALLGAGGTSNLVYNDPSDTPAASATLTLLIHDNGNTGTGGDLSASDTATINITAVNDTPNASMTTDPYAATEQVALTLKNTGMTVSDVDALGGVEVATLSVTQGILNVTSGTSGVTVGGDGTSSVTLTGTLAQINALLNTDGTSTVSYTETNDNPSATVTLTLQINDQGNTGTGGALIGTDTSTINITAVNDAPVATTPVAHYTATEQVNLNLHGTGLSVSDVDGNSGSETVTLSVVQGIITLSAGNSGVGSISGSGTSSVTFSGTLTQLNALLSGSSTGTLIYNDPSDTPAASTTLTLLIHDNGNTGGGDLTDSDTATIDITAVNDTPNASMTQDPYTATEQTTLVLKGTGMSVSDVDSLGGVERVTISVVEGTLNVTVGDSGVTVFSGNGTSSVVVDGTLAQLNALLAAGGTSNLTYIDNSDNPSASTTLTLQVNDQGNTGTGGALIGTDTSTLNITAVNDAPVATITPTEYDGQPNVAINLKNNGLSVSDVDGNAGSETVTLSVTSGTLTVTTGGSGAGVAGSGTSSVTITGTTAQINALLNTDGTSTVSYVDSAGGTKTLTLLIHDNGNTGGGDLSAQDTASIVLDQPPVVDLNGAGAGTGATLAYPENQAATVIAPAGVTTDADSADFNGGALRVSFSANGAAEDQLSILTDGTVTVSAGTVSVGGLAIGTVSGGTNGTDLLVTFNTTDATPSTVSTLIEHIGYANNSDNPSLAARTVTFLVDDGDGASGTANATINITAVNDAPAATITPTTYSATEQTALSLKNNGLAVSDIDGNAGSETVTLSVTEGTLTVTTGGSGAGVAGSGTSSVTITGTLAQINALLNTDATSTVSYSDGNDNPAASATLTLAIDDNGNTGGGNLTANDTATINITPVNDAPVATITPASYSATENVALSLKNNGLAVSDIDGNAGSETVTLSVGEGTLNVSAGGSGAVVTNSGTSSVTITGTLAQINALLNTDGTSIVSYTDGNDNPAASTTLTLQIDDNGNTGGGNLTGSDAATVNITPANDAPVATITPTSYSATEQTALSLKNNGLAVSDIDGNAGSETVTLSVTEGTLNVTAGGSGAVVTNSGTSSVTITGTIAQINALLNTDGTSTVSYVDNLDDPSASATLTLLIHDNGNTGGGDLSSNDTATINITSVNDAPGLANVPATGDYTENAAAVKLAPSILITDPDPFPHGAPGGNGLILMATAKIASGFVAGDRLLVDDTSDAPGPQTQGFYTGINVQWDYDATTHILSLFSADPPTNSGDTIIDFDHVLENVYFDSTSDDPTNGGANTTRTIEWQVQDKGGTANGGTDLSAVYTTTLTVHAINDAPVAAITPTSYSATEQTALSLKNNGLAVSDVDGSAGSETVTLSVGEGVLNVTTGGSGATVNNSGTATVTITGTAAQINALLNTDGTSTVSYIDNTDTPGASTTLTLLIHDNGNTGTGGDLSSSDTATINITAVNDAPVFTNLGEGAHPLFVENGSSVVLDNNVTVSDAELNAAGGSYGGTTLTLARNGGANPDDTFGGTGSLDLTNSNGSGENVSLDGGGTFIGTFTQPGDGTFSITFNSSATAANIASVMHQIVYANASDNPPSSVQINWSFSDGNTGSQGTGGAGIGTGSVTVDITQIDDPPVLINVAPAAAYSIGSSGVVLSPALGVFDPDATPPSPLTGIANATVKIESGFFAGDQLFVNLATSGGFFIVDDGSGPVVTNISVASNAGGTMILSGQDTTQHYQLVLDAASYRSTAADPSNGGADPTRNISWQVNDGALNSQTPNPDPNNLVNETVLHFDRPPTLDLDASGPGTGFTTTYTENAAPIAITDTDLSISDSDNANIDSATIVLTNAKAGDSLSIAGALPAGIDFAIDTSVPGQIKIRLLNSATLADYQTAVGQIRFSNSSELPDTTDRDITVVVSNTDDSNTAHATVHVVSVNDTPVNTIPGGPLTPAPNGNLTITGLSIADVDAGSGTMTTNLSVSHGTLALSGAGGAVVTGSGTGSVTVTGTQSAINATLTASGNVLYHADTGFIGVDTLTMITNDGSNTGSGGPRTDTDQVFINDGSQGEGPSPSPGRPGEGPGVIVYHSPVDLNHDGNGDLVLRHTSGTIAGWELNGPQKIVDQVISPLGNDWHLADKNDFNGDGKTDLLFRHDNGTVALWTMNGTQKAADQVVSPLGNDWHIADTADFNGDGKADILLRHDNGTVALWTMNGAQKTADQVVSPLGNDWHIADTSDFNGDGKADILLRHDNGTVAVWTMNGAQKVADQVVSPQGNDWHFLAAADFGGDGKSDILWRNDTGAVELWTMNGGLKIGDQVVSNMGNDWHYLGVGDFNADGKADILWRHDNGTVAVWEMNGPQKLVDQVVSPLGNDWHFAGLTDANGDHKTDILWRHDDGTVALWQMNGPQKAVDQVISHLGNDWVLT